MTTPAGCISLVQENLRVTLADSATFRTLTGTAARAAAQARIHHERLPAPADDAEIYSIAELRSHWPYAIVSIDDTEGLRRHQDSFDSFDCSGRVWLMIGREAPDGPDAEADREWKNTAGKIIDELCDLSLQGESDDGLVAYLQFDDLSVLQIFRDQLDDLPGNRQEMAVLMALEFSGGV